MNVLVTGGAGYIGSHAVQRLRAGGHRVVVVDDLSRGHRQAVPQDVPLYAISLQERDVLERAMEEHAIDSVMHFAALAYVGESVESPLRYYDNNVGGSVSLLRAMDRVGVRKLVFSSTCAVYGEPAELPITEEMPRHPVNPYGRTKLTVEHVLEDYTSAEPGFAYAALRYFNVAGAARDGSIGEHHEPETHLVPNVLLTALGKRDVVRLYGNDYPTPDGTCIRDYIHVEDLVDAHIVTLDALQPGQQKAYNLGIGRGTSVREIIEAAERVTGKPIEVEQHERRPGDPPVLYADPGRIERELGWKASITEVDEIIDTAWRWMVHHPYGYDAG